jgi:hypothetical protein
MLFGEYKPKFFVLLSSFRLCKDLMKQLENFGKLFSSTVTRLRRKHTSARMSSLDLCKFGSQTNGTCKQESILLSIFYTKLTMLSEFLESSYDYSKLIKTDFMKYIIFVQFYSASKIFIDFSNSATASSDVFALTFIFFKKDKVKIQAKLTLIPSTTLILVSVFLRTIWRLFEF